MQDEVSLIRRAQQGDQVALTQLYEANFDRIYRYIAIKISDRTEAEDMTQQVFLHVVQSISSYKEKGLPFTSWLYRIAHNQVVDFIRKKSKHATVPLDDSLPIPAVDGDPKYLVEKKVTVEEVVMATKKLTTAQQEVVSLRFAGELSITEVAGVMGKSEGAIKALQHSAIVALRKALATE
ncbi:MAG: sigma-70 family RNA polymerase sigma factor [Dehalococcoidales bacterium]